MAKKAKKVVPTKEDIQRRNMINEFNRTNNETKILMRKVKEEDIKELEDLLKSMQEKHSTKMYLIADVDNAERVCVFLHDWNNNRFMWSQDLWKGVIKFDEYLSEWRDKFVKEKCNLEFDFAAMSYAYNMLMNPYGLGIDDAKYMNSVTEQYESILSTLKTYVEDFQKDNERFKLLQDCLAARYQGFMMVPADEVKENDTTGDAIDDTIDLTDNHDKVTEATEDVNNN